MEGIVAGEADSLYFLYVGLPRYEATVSKFHFWYTCGRQLARIILPSAQKLAKVSWLARQIAYISCMSEYHVMKPLYLNFIFGPVEGN
jgi:hypothetical protein